MPDLDHLQIAAVACDKAKNWIDEAIREGVRNGNIDECRVCMKEALEELADATEIVLHNALALEGLSGKVEEGKPN